MKILASIKTLILPFELEGRYRFRPVLWIRSQIQRDPKLFAGAEIINSGSDKLQFAVTNSMKSAEHPRVRGTIRAKKFSQL